MIFWNKSTLCNNWCLCDLLKQVDVMLQLNYLWSFETSRRYATTDLSVIFWNKSTLCYNVTLFWNKSTLCYNLTLFWNKSTLCYNLTICDLLKQVEVMLQLNSVVFWNKSTLCYNLTLCGLLKQVDVMLQLNSLRSSFQTNVKRLDLDKPGILYKASFQDAKWSSFC